MQFSNIDIELSDSEITNIEEQIKILFPAPLRDLFKNHNGGEPFPYVFEINGIHTTVNETLPLISGQKRGTALDTYQALAIKKSLVEKNLFPFAVDSGGDYFFVDCNTPDAQVYFYLSDSLTSGLQKTNLSLGEFWKILAEES